MEETKAMSKLNQFGPSQNYTKVKPDLDQITQINCAETSLKPAEIVQISALGWTSIRSSFQEIHIIYL